MKKNSRKLKRINNQTTDENEIRNFIIIVIVISLIAALVYFGTELLNKKTEEPVEKEKTKINYDILSVGTIFNAPYNNYYVLIFNSEDSLAPQYSALLSIYDQSKSEGEKKLYSIDLKNKINGDYYNVNKDGKSNPKAEKISEFNFGDLTLLEIKNSKIVKYLEDYEQIKQLLNN